MRAGDLVLCIEHTGDCHFKYILLERITKWSCAWHGIPDCTFHAYALSKPAGKVFTSQEVAKLLDHGYVHTKEE
jgi:hypothetical protein